VFDRVLELDVDNDGRCGRPVCHIRWCDVGATEPVDGCDFVPGDGVEDLLVSRLLDFDAQGFRGARKRCWTGCGCFCCYAEDIANHR